ncbi:hypothetical protein D3C87_280020 [compost metagenome]
MLEQIKQHGLEKFAGDESLADTVVEGFVTEFIKEAAKIQEHGGPEAFKVMVNGLAESIGKGMGGLAVTTAITGLANMANIVGSDRLHTKFLEALHRAISMNALLRDPQNEMKAKQYAATIFKFAPHVATDPNVLSSVLANAVHGEGIDPQTIKSLTDLEGRLRENRSFAPKTYV